MTTLKKQSLTSSFPWTICGHACHSAIFVPDFAWKAFLTNDDLLTLASGWPQLERFSINHDWGWNMSSCGITPDGFLRLLATCPRLNYLAIVWDTRGYTKVPPSGLLARHGLTTYPAMFHLNVLDSQIQQANVRALAGFFHSSFTRVHISARPHVCS